MLSGYTKNNLTNDGFTFYYRRELDKDVLMGTNYRLNFCQK